MLRTVQKYKFTIIKQAKCISYQYSTKPAVKEESDYKEQLKEFERISNITQRTKVKKPQKPPFVKNLFLGKFDTDILTYPELTNEGVSNLNKAVNEAKSVLYLPEIKEARKISKQFLGKLASQKLIGLQTSQFMDGREIGVTESCRLFEILSEVNLKNTIICNESLGIQTLLKYSNDKIKRRYLQPLINGETVSAFCFIEPIEGNIDNQKRTALLSKDGKSWVLNGTKRFVTNGSSADFYIVLAHTYTLLRDDIAENHLTAFVVERDFGGISSTQRNLSDPNVEVSDLRFENTIVPAENIIGEINMAQDFLKDINTESRLSTGPICLHINKQLINQATEFFIKNSNAPVLLYETDAICSKIGKWTTSLFAIESMIYLTSGIIDNYENQDCELEAAIVKVFSSEQSLLNTSSCLDQIGIDSIEESHWCYGLHKEALAQICLNDSNDNLKMYIALFGLQHAGKELNELVKKLRNPLFHAHFIMKRFWVNWGNNYDNPKMSLKLHHYIHPSLITAANHLEYCVLRLKFATEVLLTRHGQNIINQHMDLRRLADVIIDIYAMTACIGRASRSYCIGLRHADMEVSLASTFSNGARERVKKNVTQILEGMYQTNDENYRHISNRIFKVKEYCPTHPLTRNF